MDQHTKLRLLIDLAESLGITVRSLPHRGGTNGASAGALVQLKGREILFLDSSAPSAEQIAVVAGALKGRSEIQDKFLPPELREIIEQA